MMPAKDARTPSNFLNVKRSTPIRLAKTSVQIPISVSRYNHDVVAKLILLLVDVRIVELATVVYSRHAPVK